MYPSIEATLRDYVGTYFDEYGEDWRIHYRRFLEIYDVEEWGISPDEFKYFIDQVEEKRRCFGCGSRQFPYYLEGDELCLRCGVEANAIH